MTRYTHHRVAKVNWGCLSLSGTLPGEIGALSALIVLCLHENDLNGELPPELGNLTSLKVRVCESRSDEPSSTPTNPLYLLASLIVCLLLRSSQALYLDNNAFCSFPGKHLPLANLTDLESLTLHDNNFITDVPPSLSYDKEKVQANIAAYFGIDEPLAVASSTKDIAPPAGTWGDSTILSNTALQQDGETVLRLWKSWGKHEYEVSPSESVTYKYYYLTRRLAYPSSKGGTNGTLTRTSTMYRSGMESRWTEAGLCSCFGKVSSASESRSFRS